MSHETPGRPQRPLEVVDPLALLKKLNRGISDERARELLRETGMVLPEGEQPETPQSSEVQIEKPGEALPEIAFTNGTNVYVRQESGPPKGMPVTGSVEGHLMSDVSVGRRLYLDGFATKPIKKIERVDGRAGWIRITAANDAIYLVSNTEDEAHSDTSPAKATPEERNEMNSAATEAHATPYTQQEGSKPRWFGRLKKAVDAQWNKITGQPEAGAHADFINKAVEQTMVGESIFSIGRHVRIEQRDPADTGPRKVLLENVVEGPVLSGVFIGRPIYLDGFATEPVTEAKRDPSNPERTIVTTKDGAVYNVSNIDEASVLALPENRTEAEEKTASALQSVREDVEKAESTRKRSWFSWFK